MEFSWVQINFFESWLLARILQLKLSIVSIVNADGHLPECVPDQTPWRYAAGMRKLRWVELHFIEDLAEFAEFLWIFWNLELLGCFCEAV